MIPTTRRAPAALRAFYLASSTSSRGLTRTTFPSQLLASQRCHVQTSFSRSFSSIYPRLQYATAEATGSDAPALSQDNEKPPEFTRFDQLSEHGIISPRVIDTITQRMNITTMTEVQQMTINHCLDGSDVIAQARTGTGKTIAFLLPIIQRILRDPELDRRPNRGARGDIDDIRALIISPTRELAEQIATEAKRIVSNTAVKVQTAVGGTQKRQHLQRMQYEGCHILVGTPGRVLDIISDRSTGVSLRNIETFVLDEADRLLDIGFAPAIADIQSHMPQARDLEPGQAPRQTLMFSATVPKSVVQLVRSTLRPNFKFIRTVDPEESPTHDRIPQHMVFGQGLQNQIPIIMEIAHNAMQAHKKDPETNMPFKAIVYFGSTAEVAMAFNAFSKMRDPDQPRSIFAEHPLHPCRIFEMHGKLQQAQRSRESQGFRNAESGILFSSDVTARGMDFPNVSHVIQIGLPKSSDDYVHRIGRTGRAGKSGEGWLILNNDERRDIASKMRNSGINLVEKNLITSDLDMTRGAQIPAHIARLLKYVETGVKAVPYSTKESTYMALLGVLSQQNPHRSKEAQVTMMNELAKFGWGMQEPPAINSRLAAKIGFTNVRGVRIEDGRDMDRGDGGRGFGGRDDRRGGFGDRDGGRDDRRGGGFGDRNGGSFGGRSDRRGGGFGDRNGGSFGDRNRGDRSGDSVEQTEENQSGKGVFGGGDAFAQMGMNDDRGRGDRNGRGGRGGFGGRGGQGGRRF